MYKDKEGNNVLKEREFRVVEVWEGNGRVEHRKGDLGAIMKHLACQMEKILFCR